MHTAISQKQKPQIKCPSNIYAIKGADNNELKKIQNYIINPVESRLCRFEEKPETLTYQNTEPKPIKTIDGFIDMDKKALEKFHSQHEAFSYERGRFGSGPPAFLKPKTAIPTKPS